MVESDGRCEVAECGKGLVGGSRHDKYFKKFVCVSCFEKHFRAAEESGIGDWFEANYEKTAYPPEFWRKVGAFVDLSQCKSQDPYK